MCTTEPVPMHVTGRPGSRTTSVQQMKQHRCASKPRHGRRSGRLLRRQRRHGRRHLLQQHHHQQQQRRRRNPLACLTCCSVLDLFKRTFTVFVSPPPPPISNPVPAVREPQSLTLQQQRAPLIAEGMSLLRAELALPPSRFCLKHLPPQSLRQFIPGPVLRKEP